MLGIKVPRFGLEDIVHERTAKEATVIAIVLLWGGHGGGSPQSRWERLLDAV
jgi:hypothetical protein